MSDKGNIIDPKTWRVSARSLIPGGTIKMPEGMKTVPAETPSRFHFREPVKRDAKL